MKGFRRIVAFLVFLAGLFALGYLQRRFDTADRRKALEVVQAKFPERGCQAEVVSRMKGIVRVTCKKRIWRVDLVQGLLGEDDGREMSD